MQRRIALVLSLSLSGPGCSFVLTNGPGDVGNPPTVVADCTEGNGWPIFDIIAAGLLSAAVAGNVGMLTGNDTGNETLGPTPTAAALVGALGFGASAFYGFSRTSKCRHSHAAYALAHPAPVARPVAYYPAPGSAPIGSPGGFCTQQNTCDAGLVCAGMPDHTNKCLPSQPQPPLVTVGEQGGACTQQLTCNEGLVCAGMPDRTNKCVPAPPPGAQGGACMANNACNTGLVCAGMPDHTNKCMPAG